MWQRLCKMTTYVLTCSQNCWSLAKSRLPEESSGTWQSTPAVKVPKICLLNELEMPRVHKDQRNNIIHSRRLCHWEVSASGFEPGTVISLILVFHCLGCLLAGKRLLCFPLQSHLGLFNLFMFPWMFPPSNHFLQHDVFGLAKHHQNVSSGEDILKGHSQELHTVETHCLYTEIA